MKGRLENSKFHCAIEYTPEKRRKIQNFVDEVSDARHPRDIEKAYELIAETMKMLGNSGYGKAITNKKNYFYNLWE